MKYTNILWLIITDKQFRHLLCDAIIYALMSHDQVRGYYSPSVKELNDKYMNDIFDKQYQIHIKAYKEKFQCYFNPK